MLMNPDHIDWNKSAPGWKMELAAQLAEPPHIANALAVAYDRFCVHHDRARFNAEIKAIRSCKL